MQHRSRTPGYSLYELLMTIAVAAAVLTLGVPSFGGLLADQRLRVEVDALFHAIHVARKASLVRRRVVTLCPTYNGNVCEPGPDWSMGWMMFVNTDRDEPAVRDNDEAVLLLHDVDRNTRITANRQSFTLRSTALRATNGTLVFCDRAGRAVPRALVVSYTGRPRVTRTDGNGKAYACPE